jgi:hypothetical protein
MVTYGENPMEYNRQVMRAYRKKHGDRLREIDARRAARERARVDPNTNAPDWMKDRERRVVAKSDEVRRMLGNGRAA